MLAYKGSVLPITYWCSSPVSSILAGLHNLILQIKGNVVTPGHVLYTAAISQWTKSAERDVTGVGGLTLGGGFGWLSSRYGLAIDNLRQATVVTADESILKASEAENTDLFWGICGGGSNFVAEFVLQLYPHRRTAFASLIVYTMDKVEEVTREVRKWWPTITDDEDLFQMVSLYSEAPVLDVLVFYNAYVVDGVKEVPYEKLNTLTRRSSRASAITLLGQPNESPTPLRF
ncbi:hypothetical protein BKA70DRAFT_1419584 [Coprinopsis sp. MPI-PUGE-AT-0042]|nr:hypothetical protein BKA70DRAFT_1419584 [Coprinopsis sp. MPI-PUGE-AT-0042]